MAVCGLSTCVCLDACASLRISSEVKGNIFRETSKLTSGCFIAYIVLKVYMVLLEGKYYL